MSLSDDDDGRITARGEGVDNFYGMHFFLSLAARCERETARLIGSLRYDFTAPVAVRHDIFSVRLIGDDFGLRADHERVVRPTSPAGRRLLYLRRAVRKARRRVMAPLLSTAAHAHPPTPGAWTCGLKTGTTRPGDAHAYPRRCGVEPRRPNGRPPKRTNTSTRRTSGTHLNMGSGRVGSDPLHRHGLADALARLHHG